MRFPLSRYKTTGEELSLVPPTCKAYNLVIGRLWVDTFGDMVIENITSKWKTTLEFVPCGYFGAGRYVVCPFYSLCFSPLSLPIFALRSEKTRRLSIDVTK